MQLVSCDWIIIVGEGRRYTVLQYACCLCAAKNTPGVLQLVGGACRHPRDKEHQGHVRALHAGAACSIPGRHLHSLVWHCATVRRAAAAVSSNATALVLRLMSGTLLFALPSGKAAGAMTATPGTGSTSEARRVRCEWEVTVAAAVVRQQPVCPCGAGCACVPSISGSQYLTYCFAVKAHAH